MGDTTDTTLDATPSPPKKNRRRVRAVAQLLATVAIGAAALLVGVYVLPRLTSVDSGSDSTPSVALSPQDTTSPSLPVPGGPLPGAAAQSPAPLPSPTPTPTPTSSLGVRGTGRPSDALAAWATGLSRLGIPPVALQAYGYTELVINRTQPKCRLSWTMLAGIGAIESDHGRTGRSKLRPDGTSEPPIVGIPLDGTASDRIPDTDQGLLDGNKQFDQAMGPMQFIPSTWKRWAADADNDHKTNPFDIDDAALTAGRYLCAGGRDLGKGADWWNAVLAYNNVPRYATQVYARADQYGRSSLG